MSKHLSKYNKRLKRSGLDVGDVYANNTISYIEATFHASPTFRVLDVNSFEFPNIEKIDARVVEIERMGNIREILFRPNQGLNLGTYVSFDGDTWMVYDKHGSQKSTKIKVTVEKCNRTLKWKDKHGDIQEIDCIASATQLGSKANQGKNDIEWNKYDVSLPLGYLFVFVEKNPITDTIKRNQRFIFGRNVYEVIGIDDTSLVDKNGYGVIQYTTKVTTIQDKDDFANRIAFNTYKKEDNELDLPSESIDEDDKDKGNGGRLW